MKEKKYLHIYIGNGKGKTTAAAGLSIRALGRNLSVAFLQFLKNGSSGEIKSLEMLGAKTFSAGGSKFFYLMTAAEQKNASNEIISLLNNIEALHFDIIVLDEILDVIDNNIISESRLTDFINHKLPESEIILTGRTAGDNLIKLADYVSEIHAVKHPYNKNIPARKGIEY